MQLRTNRDKGRDGSEDDEGNLLLREGVRLLLLKVVLWRHQNKQTEGCNKEVGSFLTRNWFVALRCLFVDIELQVQQAQQNARSLPAH